MEEKDTIPATFLFVKNAILINSNTLKAPFIHPPLEEEDLSMDDILCLGGIPNGTLIYTGGDKDA